MQSEFKKSSVYRTEGNPAPGELVRFQGFLNTWSEELSIEDLNTPKATEQWLRDTCFWTGKKHVTTHDHQRILEIRYMLRQFVLHPDRIDEIEIALASLSFTMELDQSGRPKLQPQGQEIDLVMGRLISIVYNSMAEGIWSRFKCCALESCAWAFYDSTRSHTKRWCSMRTCGSRHKARQYNKRKRKL